MLDVSDQGPIGGQTYLLIHGWSQDKTCWSSQTPLADTCRLVAVDLRGHGASDAPADAASYTSTRLWAEDIQAILTELEIDQPVLVGWSYGCRVISAYLEIYGQAALGGIALVGGPLVFGKGREDWMINRKSPMANRDLFSDDNEKRMTATRRFVAGCFETTLAPETLDAHVAINMRVSALVRRALFAADWDFREQLAELSLSTLVIHGENDRIVDARVGNTAANIAPNAKLRLYENAGHAPFLEQPTRFNADLKTFATATLGAAA